MSFLKPALLAALVAVTAVPSFAHGVHLNPDRVEDRMDRRENRRDEAVDHGPLDVIEDHLDRAEDRRDRRENRPHYHDGTKVIIVR
ncbi:MAG: hypothetical protein MRY77_05250 [Rhodobacteraceae bacterium]|nr:hypothetical protein [Paracoccaceae bacterium]